MYDLSLVEGEGWILSNVPDDFQFKCTKCKKPTAFGYFCVTTRRLFCKECNKTHDYKACLGGFQDMVTEEGHVHFHVIEIKKDGQT